MGRAPGRYDLRRAADFSGQRLNRTYRENVDESTILASLEPLFAGYARERKAAEHFGDWLLRSGVLDPPALAVVA